MLISLCVMAVATGLAAHASVVQLRFFRGAGEIVAVRGQLGAVGTVTAAALWGIAPGRDDIVFASDSALEVRSAIGSSVVCWSASGRVTIPSPEPRGNTLSAFDAVPDDGDLAEIFVEDSTGSGWLRASVASVSSSNGLCHAFPSVSGTLELALREPLELPSGAVLRFSRPIRLSHYRASDGLWYFGVRDWNGIAQRLNTVQPVAGPLHPRSADAVRSGLVFRYLDAVGSELAAPVDPARIAAVAVVARARSRRPVRVAGMALPGDEFSDSAVTIIALRNAR